MGRKRKHTPGPWQLVRKDRPGMEPRWDVLKGIYYVADPMTSSAYRDFAETTANAKLIAAAPTMLDALDKADALLRKLSEAGLLDQLLHSSSPDEINETCDTVRSAIRAACGDEEERAGGP